MKGHQIKIKLFSTLIVAFCLSNALNVIGANIMKADKMKNIILNWPPEGWQLNAPLSSEPIPPYVKDGEFSAVIYRQKSDKSDYWSADIKITDKLDPIEANAMFDLFPFCNAIQYRGKPARECGAMGSKIGRRGIIYTKDRFFIEISVTGPKPIEIPSIELRE